MNRAVRALGSALIVLAPLAFVVTGLEFAVRGGFIDAYLVPAPSSVLEAFTVDLSEFAAAFLDTASSALLGFAVAVAAGSLVAAFFSLSRRLERALYPYAVFFQTVPIVAVAPLLVIWFGFGRPTVVASSAIVAFFPVVAGALAGLRSAERALVQLFRLYGAGRVSTLLKLRVPSAIPQYLTGLRIAAGLSIVGALVGELIGGGGLGSVVDIAKTQQRVDKVFAAVLLATFLGFVATALLGALERWAGDSYRN